MRGQHLLAACLLLGACLPCAADPVDDALAGRIGAGTLTESEAALWAIVDAGGDDRARLALGLVRSVRAGERLLQTLYSFGAGEPVRDGGMQLMPALGAMPYNAQPRTLELGMLTDAARQWVADLGAADRTLAEITDPGVKLRIDVAAMRLDVDGNGRIDREEVAGPFYRNVVMAGLPPPEGDTFELALDRADVEWMRAYAHVLMAAGELFIAHGWQDVFERAGHLLFPKTRTPHEYLRGAGPLDLMQSGLDISDLVAFIHLLSVECDEPGAMARAREHLLETIRHSRSMWEFALAETDNDREWLPAPDQDGAIAGVRITQERVRMWRELLDEGEALLEGRRLVRFWRGDGTLGINIKRVFTEPSGFDLVLWVQGSAARPYLERGEFVREGFWRDMEEAFGRDLWGYLFYIN